MDWSAHDKAKAQADKHRIDPYVLVISSFSTEMWLGRRKRLYKTLKLAEIRIGWKGEGFFEKITLLIFYFTGIQEDNQIFHFYFFDL